MFYNTIGGIYSKDKNTQVISYTFPEDAYYEINEVQISLSGLKVKCYGGDFDGVTTQHFSHVSSLVPLLTTL